MWNFQMGSKLWDAQPISSMQSLKSLYKILEIDLGTIWQELFFHV